MKKILIVCAALSLYATSAFAIGCDFTLTACPGNAGTTQDMTGVLDCAGGGTLVGLITFQPANPLTDLVGASAVVDFTVPNMQTTNNFWEFSVGNPAALAGAQGRPATGCTGYVNTFGVANAAFGIGAFPKNNYQYERIAIVVARPTNLVVAANSKQFCAQMTIDASTSAESGLGTATGCSTAPVAMLLQSIDPSSAGGDPNATQLANPSLTAAPGVVGNGGSLSTVVPTRRHTWGQLKSLYR